MGANLKAFYGVEVRHNSKYPNVMKWFEAIDEVNSVKDTRSDDETLNNVIGKVFMGGAVQLNTVVGSTPKLTFDGEIEAAWKLSSNRIAVVGDVMKNAGVDEDVEDVVDAYVRALATILLRQELAGFKASSSSNKAVGAAVLAFLRNRVSSPRDMTAEATVAFRDGCDRLIRQVF